MLSASRTEPTAPATPSKQRQPTIIEAMTIPTRSTLQQRPLTPPSLHKPSPSRLPYSSKPRPKSPDLLDDFQSSDEEAFAEAVEKVEVMAPPPRPAAPETPRKAVKTNTLASPGKQRFEPWAREERLGPGGSDDAFWTPVAGGHDGPMYPQSAGGLMSPVETPTPIRTARYPQLPEEPSSPTPGRRSGRASDVFNDPPASSLFGSSPLPADGPSPLADETEATPTGADILNLLRDQEVRLEGPLINEVKALGARYDRKLRMVERGRDVSRDAVKRREAKIAEQVAAIARRESDIANLKEIVSALRKERDAKT